MNMKYAVIINGDDEYTVESHRSYEDAQNAIWATWSRLTNEARMTLYNNSGCNVHGIPYMVAVDRTTDESCTLSDLLKTL